jgi:uncharacterized protein involved in outer membrane biogenesis
VVRRLILAIVAALVILVAVAAGAAYWFFARDGFRRALEAQATAWSGQPVQIGATRAQFLPRLAIQLEDIHVGDPVQLALGRVELAADIRPLLAGRIENADVLVSDSRIDMPMPFGLPRSTDTGARNTSDPAVRIVSIRSIALRNVRLRSRGREIVVSADSSLNDTTLSLRRFTAEAGGTTLAAEGVVALSPRIDARLEATANRLDVDELIALADAFTPPASAERRGAQGQHARIVASVSAGQATAGAIQMRQFATELALDGDSIALNRLQFEMFRGRYQGSVTARLGTPLSATLESRITDLDVGQLAAFGGVPDTITGRLSGAGTFTGSGADVAQLLRGARGNGTAAIVDGSIRRLHLVRTVVLFFGRPAPGAGEGTDRFDRLDATFALANRVLRAQAFSLRSADADIAGEGSLNLDTDTLDGRADIRLSEGLSDQAGTDLYRYTREGTRVVLPASITGTLAMPRLTIDAAAAAKRGLRNEIERRLKGVLEGFGR